MFDKSASNSCQATGLRHKTNQRLRVVFGKASILQIILKSGLLSWMWKSSMNKVKLVQKFIMKGNDSINYYKKLVGLITIATIIRLIIASSVELSNAEVYYWTFALKLKLNYFDHPPIVGWLIKLTTLNLLLHSETFVRLGAILASAICTWLIFKIGALINNLRTGWIAALLYTSSLYGSFVAGSFILPDSPEMIFWMASLYILIKISLGIVQDKKTILLWCMLFCPF